MKRILFALIALSLLSGCIGGRIPSTPLERTVYTVPANILKEANPGSAENVDDPKEVVRLFWVVWEDDFSYWWNGFKYGILYGDK